MELLQLIKGSKTPEPRGGASFVQYDVGKFLLLGIELKLWEVVLTETEN